MSTKLRKYLKDYQSPEYTIIKTDLIFKLDPNKTQVVATLSIKKNIANAKDLILDGEDLILKSVSLNDKILTTNDYDISEQQLKIGNIVDENFILTITNEISPVNNTALSGLYISNGLFCTQCEAQGFRRITYYLDRPDVMSIFTTTIIADQNSYPILLSNGNKIESKQLSDGKHLVKWNDPFKKPAYLFALVAGDLAQIKSSFTTMSNRNIDILFYVEPHNKQNCGFAIESLKNAMRFDEQYYNREYDLDNYMVVAVSNFNMGAMENKGLNIFNDKYVLANPNTATDKDYELIEAVVGHEYFHNWTGNRITLRDWFQLSLKEGLTVFREQHFSASQGQAANKRIEQVMMLRARQFPEDSGPMKHPVRPESYIEINNFYTMTVYEKGSEVIRMLHTLLGEAEFSKGMDAYFEKYDKKAITVEDFVNIMAKTSNKNLSQFMHWYEQAGTPEVKVQSDYNSNTQQLELTLSQSIPVAKKNAKLLYIPFKISLFNEHGKIISINNQENHLIELTKQQQKFTFDNIITKPIISINRGFSAPVNIVDFQSQQELSILYKHDNDPFNQYEAGQNLFINAILNEKNSDLSNACNVLVEAMRLIINNTELADDIKACVLTMPSLIYLAEKMHPIDPAILYQSYTNVKKYLAKQLQDELKTCVKNIEVKESYKFEPLQIGKRMLTARCLDYLAALDTEDVMQYCLQKFNTADNMTTKFDALSSLCKMQTNEFQTQALDEFYAQYNHEHLLVDKWFAVQASNFNKDKYFEIISLTKHEKFNFATPNKVYSVCVAFATNNFAAFHLNHLKSYMWLAEQVLKLNSKNPQVAARVVKPLLEWHKFADPYRNDMLGALKLLQQQKDLSADVYELVEQAINQ